MAAGRRRGPAVGASMGGALEDETAAGGPPGPGAAGGAGHPTGGGRAGDTQGGEPHAVDREWVEVTFADPARAAEWIAQQGVLAGHVRVLRAHRGQAALRLYLTARQRRALPGSGRGA